ncbi:MAG: phospholipase D-like domain-containing protein [Elusimicrobiales bacterium]|nr:phospholipase D-like domain-containing protein [Elusimicrobiales bacterium]
MKIYRKVLVILFLIESVFLFSYSSKSLDPEVIKNNFSISINFDEVLRNVPEVSYISEFRKTDIGDFSHIKNYAFAYINNLIVDAVNASKSTIDCVIYSIQMKDVPDALIAARDRGVKVRIIIDESHVYPRPDTQIKKLINAGEGIEVRTLRGTRSYGVMHNKITIHDKSLITTGSYNWTFASTFSNYENLVALKKPEYVNGYVKYFEWMWSKSRTIQQGPSGELPVGYFGIPPQSPQNMLTLNGIEVPLYIFSPGSDMENKLAKLIDTARVSIDAVTFTFSSKSIADAIIRAYRRGIKVRFLEDKNMARASEMAKMIFEAGVPFKWIGGRNEKGSMHNKFIIFDGKILATGSYNFTTNGSINSFENMVFINDESTVKAYISNFNWFYSQASSPQSVDEFDEVDTSRYQVQEKEID